MPKPKLTPDLLSALQDAFPGGYLRLDGIRTIGGHFCFRLPDKGYVWYLPGSNQFTKVGNKLFDDEKKKLTFLPDITHYPTFLVLLAFLAEMVNAPTEQGLRWYPATRGKTVVGWNLHGRGTAKTFKGVTAREGKLALLQTITMMRCRCAELGRKNCPKHGTHKCWT